MGETRLGESRIDEAAELYEASLTPDAVMLQRQARR